jgi:hypothetical protein
MRETNEQRMQRANRLFSVLQKIKEKCDNGDFYGKGKTITQYLCDNRFSNTTYLTALRGLGIIYRDDNNVQRWKNNIPVTKKLTITIMEKSTQITKAQEHRRLKKVIVKKQVIPQKPQPKQRGGAKPNSVRKIKQHEIKNYLPKVGLIRRFLRWLY